MSIENIKEKIVNAINKLESSGDIVVTTTTPNTIIDKVVEALGNNLSNHLNDDEFRAILNCLNVLAYDVKLDARDFQTVIGVEKDELKLIFDKLNQFNTTPTQT
jgi:hypothetical protein